MHIRKPPFEVRTQGRGRGEFREKRSLEFVMEGEFVSCIVILRGCCFAYLSGRGGPYSGRDTSYQRRDIIHDAS